MNDLAPVLAGLAALSLIAFVAGVYISSRWRKEYVIASGSVVLAALLLFVWKYHGTWQMARILPISGAIVLGNWIPVGGAFFGGMILGEPETPQWRRCSLASLILLASGYSVGCCFLGLLPSVHHTTSSTSVQQSHASSCGACCAASLLRYHGIEADEEEMLNLCLTSYRGCPALGLYRGLKLKTAGTQWDVEVVTCTADELIRLETPMLLRVGLPSYTYVDDLGHIHEKRRHSEHAVLLMKAPDDRHLEMIDPAVELNACVIWDLAQLKEQWRGEALRLAPRPQ